MIKIPFYQENKKTEIAEKEINKIVDDFINKYQQWCDKYSHLGVDDTSSREAFAQQVAKDYLRIFRLD